jgi:exportin-2 (importin alpha re-exporter)
LPTYYQNLIAPILAPQVWESKGNIPALVRLLSSIISRGSQFILENNQLINTLGIFQKLLSSKTNESYGFDLLESVIEHFPSYVGHCMLSRHATDTSSRTTLEPYFGDIMQIILTRLQNHKTESLSLRFVRFYHFMCANDAKGYSADFVIQVIDKVQEG